MPPSSGMPCNCPQQRGLWFQLRLLLQREGGSSAACLTGTLPVAAMKGAAQAPAIKYQSRPQQPPPTRPASRGTHSHSPLCLTSAAHMCPHSKGGRQLRSQCLNHLPARSTSTPTCMPGLSLLRGSWLGFLFQCTSANPQTPARRSARLKKMCRQRKQNRRRRSCSRSLCAASAAAYCQTKHCQLLVQGSRMEN